MDLIHTGSEQPLVPPPRGTNPDFVLIGMNAVETDFTHPYRFTKKKKRRQSWQEEDNGVRYQE